MSIVKVAFRLANASDDYLPTFDNTKLVAVNTCPTWGIVRYGHHKTFNAATRALPLEMGSAMHDVFAWVRLCTLMQQASVRDRPEDFRLTMFEYHMRRLFGDNRTNIILDNTPATDDVVAYCKHGALNVVETSGYYDDPRDRRRTLSNMEEATLAYIDKWRWTNAIWQQNPDDPIGMVGIEMPFDIVVNINDNELVFRYTGKIDGIQYREQEGPHILYIGENKTTSRINDTWSQGFSLATQITGYCVAGTVITEQSVMRAFLFGLSIPLPKSYDYGGIVSETLHRQDYHVTRWIEWMKHTVELYREYINRPLEAPMYTHSCNRYFRTCPFMALCDAPQEDRIALLDSMETQEWSPLHKVEQE